MRGRHVGAPSSGTRDKAVQRCYVSSQQLRRASRARPLPNAAKAFAIKSKQSVDVEWRAIVSTLSCASVRLPTATVAVDA
jgi:hypothetical protein